MDQYMALSKKDLMIHITMNELYNTHSLILQHIETLVSSLILTHFRWLFTASSHPTINNTYVSSPTSLAQPHPKFHGRRTGRLS